MNSPEPPQADAPPRDLTRQRLLEVGRRCFAERGFHGVSIRTITQAAGCNVAAVNYHFGGKEGLYRAVFEEILTMLRESRLAAVRRGLTQAEPDTSEPSTAPPTTVDQPHPVAERSGLSLERLLRSFARAFVQPLTEAHQGQTIMRLMQREMMDPHLPAKLFHQQMIQPLVGSLGPALRQTCPGLSEASSRWAILSIVGQLLQFLQLIRFFERAETQDRADLPEPEMDRAIEHVVRFSAAGVRASARADLAASSSQADPPDSRQSNPPTDPAASAASPAEEPKP